MDKKYKFDIKSFNKINLWKFVLIWLLISLFFNMLVIKEKWNIGIMLIIMVCCGLTPLGVYIFKIRMWSSAYILFNNSQILYFRKIKDGYTDPELYSGYVYEAWLTYIKFISKINVNKSNIIINGDIEIEKSLNKTNSNSKIKNVNYVKIPLYFEKKDEIIENISKYIVK